jgi:5-methylcytosine-specific restriction endonuclease McrA
MLISLLTYSVTCAMLLSVELQHPLAPGEGQTMKSITPDLPPASGYSDQPQGEVCPPVQTGGAAFLQCCDCSAVKEASRFSVRRISKRTGMPSYDPVCKECRNAVCSVAQKAKYAALSGDERRTLNRAKSRKRRQHGTPLSERAYCANRQAIKKGIRGRLTVCDVEAAWEKWGGKCWVCEDDATAIDHFIPTNKRCGGTNTADNIRPICADCNHKRSRLWFGAAKTEKEAVMLKQIKEMLHGL